MQNIQKACICVRQKRITNIFYITRRERLKSALYLRLKKAQFFKNLLKGGPLRLSKNPVCCKISKKLRGDPLETFEKYKKFFGKIFEKKTKNEIFETVS